MAETTDWVAFGTEYRALVDLPGIAGARRVGAGAGARLRLGKASVSVLESSACVDLAEATSRRLNPALHGLPPDNNRTFGAC